MRRIMWMFVILSPLFALLPAVCGPAASGVSGSTLAHAEIVRASVKVANIVRVVHMFLT